MPFLERRLKDAIRLWLPVSNVERGGGALWGGGLSLGMAEISVAEITNTDRHIALAQYAEYQQ